MHREDMSIVDRIIAISTMTGVPRAISSASRSSESFDYCIGTVNLFLLFLTWRCRGA